jgi:hypothetical protein
MLTIYLTIKDLSSYAIPLRDPASLEHQQPVALECSTTFSMRMFFHIMLQQGKTCFLTQFLFEALLSLSISSQLLWKAAQCFQCARFSHHVLTLEDLSSYAISLRGYVCPEPQQPIALESSITLSMRTFLHHCSKRKTCRLAQFLFEALLSLSLSSQLL